MCKKPCDDRSRRNFLLRCSGILAGLLAPVTAGGAARKRDLKSLLRTIEMESLPSARPVRIRRVDDAQAASVGRQIAAHGVLSAGTVQLNPAAEFIWQSCDGRNTPSDIARAMCNRFAVTYPQAYADTLCFLVELSNRNLVRLQ